MSVCRTSVLISSLFVCAVAHAVPRAITDAEKIACEAVADHLARGPIAIADRSNLKLDEIEARVGPNADARWQLRTSGSSDSAVFHVVFPSGVDDVITFKVNNGRIQSIRCLAESSGGQPPSAVGAAAAALIMMVIVVTRKRRMWPYILAVAAAAVVAIVMWPKRPHVATVTAAQPVEQQSSFAPLVAVRRAVAAGDSLPQIGQMPADMRDIAVMWRAQRQLGRVNADEIERQLATVSSSAPLVSLIRARLAAAEGRRQQALDEYEKFRQTAPQNDALWWEEEMVSPRETATQPLRRAIQLQTRDADIYYLLSIDHFIHDKQQEAVGVFHEAFSLKPVARATVVGSGILSLLPRDWSSSALIDTSAPDEPKTIDGALSENAMRVSPGTQSTATGSFVRLAINGAILEIPGGASIAPTGTQVLNGEEMDKVEADDAVQRATKLSDALVTSGAVQHTIENAVDALAAHNRWGDIIRLTDAITPQSENVSADLLTARVRALVRAKQFAQARQLATSRAAVNAIAKRQSVYLASEMAELLAQAGAYDDALSMYRAAKNLKNAPDLTERITRVGLRRTLDMATETAHTAHFEIHSMPEVPPQIPKKIGDELEADLQTLMSRFGLRNFKTVRVNVLRWDDFRWSVTGSDYVVGFYDGDLTVPWGTLLFGLSSQSVTTHELTHAVVAQASNDNAPRWFQEGIAQRMERVEKQENIFDPSHKRPFVALALLDSMLQGSADIRDIGSAYTESQTVMRFLEDRYGAQSINKMIAAYRGGATNEDAIQAATHKSIADLDREFRAWGATHNKPFVSVAAQ